MEPLLHQWWTQDTSNAGTYNINAPLFSRNYGRSANGETLQVGHFSFVTSRPVTHSQRHMEHCITARHTYRGRMLLRQSTRRIIRTTLLHNSSCLPNADGLGANRAPHML
jgi:hypothetical protein